MLDFIAEANVPCILIYVVPTDVRLSSQEHGKNLSRHNAWFNEAYEQTVIENKIKVDYNTLADAVEYVKEVLGLKVPVEEETEAENNETE